MKKLLLIVLFATGTACAQPMYIKSCKFTPANVSAIGDSIRNALGSSYSLVGMNIHFPTREGIYNYKDGANWDFNVALDPGYIVDPSNGKRDTVLGKIQIMGPFDDVFAIYRKMFDPGNNDPQPRLHLPLYGLINHHKEDADMMAEPQKGEVIVDMSNEGNNYYTLKIKLEGWTIR